MADKTLYLLDGMALVYRGHFAMIRNPRMTSKGAEHLVVIRLCQYPIGYFGQHTAFTSGRGLRHARADISGRDIQRIQGTTRKKCPKT